MIYLLQRTPEEGNLFGLEIAPLIFGHAANLYRDELATYEWVRVLEDAGYIRTFHDKWLDWKTYTANRLLASPQHISSAMHVIQRY